MKTLLASVLLCAAGCAPSGATYVLPDEFSAEQELMLQDGADLWNERVPAHEAINLVFGVTPRNPERYVMSGTELGSPGWTWAARGITRIDVIWLEANKAMFLLPAVAAHELAHLHGVHHIGSPTALMYNTITPQNRTVTVEDMAAWREAH
jgi:hypothetical protein